jgi:hypothetical protein
MLGFSSLEDAYKQPERKVGKPFSSYYKAVARPDGQFDLYNFNGCVKTGEPKVVSYSTVKSLRKDNGCTVEGAWVG